jgi:hypothetical protein
LLDTLSPLARLRTVAHRERDLDLVACHFRRRRERFPVEHRGREIRDLTAKASKVLQRLRRLLRAYRLGLAASYRWTPAVSITI